MKLDYKIKTNKAETNSHTKLIPQYQHRYYKFLKITKTIVQQIYRFIIQ